MPRYLCVRFVSTFGLLLLQACGGGGASSDGAPQASATVSLSSPTPIVTEALSTPTPVATAEPAVAWAAGGRSLIRSDDGGLHWTETDHVASAVAFSDRGVGWIVSGAGAGAIMRTGDGGRTWTDQIGNFIDERPVLQDVAAADRSRAVAVGLEARANPESVETSPAAVYTDNGGTTWLRAGLPNIGVDDVALLATCLSPSGVGLAAGTSRDESLQTLLLLTHDAGRSWEEITDRLPRRPGAQVECGPENRLWFLGEDSTVFMSEDDGVTWLDRHGDLPAGLNLRRGVFLDGGVAWIAVTEPLQSRLLVFQTINGGATWTPQVVDDGPGFFAAIGLAALDAMHAVVVAQDVRAFGGPTRSSFGMSWVTLDGGASWVATEHPQPVNALWDVALLP